MADLYYHPSNRKEKIFIISGPSELQVASKLDEYCVFHTGENAAIHVLVLEIVPIAPNVPTDVYFIGKNRSGELVRGRYNTVVRKGFLQSR